MIVVQINLSELFIPVEHIPVYRFELIMIEENDFKISILAEQMLIDVLNFICAEWQLLEKAQILKHVYMKRVNLIEA